MASRHRMGELASFCITTGDPDCNDIPELVVGSRRNFFYQYSLVDSQIQIL